MDAGELMMNRFFGGAAAQAAALAIIVLCVAASCSDSSTSSDWAVGEGSPSGFPVRQGIYRGEFEVIDDGCEPSLAEYIERREDYPLPLMPVWVDEPQSDAAASARSYVQTNVYSWRDAYLVHVGFLVDPVSQQPTSEPLFSENWVTIQGFNLMTGEERPRMDCPMNLGESAESRLTVTQPAADTIEVRIDANWSDVEVCAEEIHYDIYPTLPRQNCHEAYVATYELVTPCPSPCEVDVDGSVTAGLPGEGYPMVEYGEPPRCVCPDEDGAGDD